MVVCLNEDIINLVNKVYLNVVNGERGFASLRPYKPFLIELTHKALAEWDHDDGIEPVNSAPFQVVDFFCGCGGMSLGFAALSKVHPFFKIVGGCDINSDALETYRSNFRAPGILADVRALASDNEELRKFMDQLDNYDKKKPLIVIGCAPCQGFTSHRKKELGLRKTERNNLVANFTSIAVRLNTECIIMENVPELLSEKYWNYFHNAISMLTKAGYVVRQSIYNGASFGVPQERFRAIVIAMKRNFFFPETSDR